jgi:unsaturated rhamnogalacturonyl hydrolase
MTLSYSHKLVLVLAATALAACSGPPEEGTGQPAPTAPLATVELSNPSEFARGDELTTLDLDAVGVASDGEYRIESGGAELPSQPSDTDGDGSVDALVFVADFGPAERKTFELHAGQASATPQRTQAEVSVKQGGEWDGKLYKGGEFVNVDAVEPPSQYTDHSEYIRYEGPGIESDRIGYRVYLDWRNGFDIFGKTTNAMVLQGIGLDGYGSYHEPADWGLDILKVGDAVGIGGYGFWDGEQLIRVSETEGRAARIIENGPLTSTLEITYDAWKAGEYVSDLRALLSMNAGSRLVRVRLEASPDLPNLAIGLVKHPDAEVIAGDLEISGHAWTYVATWGPQALAEGDLGMVLLFRRNARKEQTEDEHNIVSVMQPGDGRLEYYFGAAWSEEPGGVTSREAFIEWLDREAERLTMSLRSRIRSAHTEAQTAAEIDAAAALEWSVRLARSGIDRLGDDLQHGGFDSDGNRDARWSYTTGLLAQAMDDLADATGESAFAEWGRATIDSYVTADGEILTYDASLFDIDHVNSGKMLLRYIERFGDDRYRKAADAIRAQLADHPRTSEGAFWHKQRYPWQLWLDGVYMGMPFLAHYSLLTDDTHGIEEAVNEFLITRKHLRDDETGLYFHAWDERAEQVWADPDTGLSLYFWSRGMG